MRDGIPYRRLLTEGVVVVGSILLAFAIDAWWDGYKDAQEEQRVLTAITLELDANLSRLHQSESFHRATLSSVNELLRLATQDPIAVEGDSLDALLARVTVWGIPNYERGALDAALRGGGLSVIETHDLRQQLASWERALDQTTEFESYDERTTSEQWIPLLAEYGSLAQVSNAGVERVPNWRTSYTPILANRDHNLLIRAPQFVNVMTQRKMTVENILIQQARLEQDLEDLRGMLELFIDVPAKDT